MPTQKHRYYWCWLFILFCSSLVSPLFAQPTEEAILRALVEQYFSAYAREDMTALGQLWSASAFAARQKGLEKLFADHDRIEVRALTVRQFKAEGERARLRVMLESSAVNAKTGKPANGFGKQNRSFHFVRENGGWQIRREESVEEEIAELLLAAPTIEQQQTILATEQEFLSERLARLLQRQVAQLRGQGKFQEAVARNRLTELVAEKIDLKNVRASVHIDYGSIALSQGDYLRALEHTEKAIALGEQWGDQRVLMVALSNAGLMHFMLGDHAKAVARLRKSLQITEAQNDKAATVRTLGSLAYVLTPQGNYLEAAAIAQRMFSLAEELSNKELMMHAVQTLADVHLAQGNYDQALEGTRKVLTLAQEISNPLMISAAHSMLGNVYQSREEYDLALQHFQESLKVLDTQENSIATLVFQGIAGIHLEQKAYTSALEYAQRSLRLCEQAHDRANLLLTLELISRIDLAQGNTAQALQSAEQAVQLAQETGITPALIGAQTNRGKALRSLKKEAEARDAFTSAIATVEKLRLQLYGSEPEQQRFFENSITPYYEMISLLADKEPATAFAMAERAKSRVLVDVLQRGRITINNALTTQEQEQEERLRKTITDLNLKLGQAARQEAPDLAQRKTWQTQLQEARLAYEAFQLRLHAAHPELQRQRGEASVIGLSETAQLLPNDKDDKTALLEFSVTEDKVYLFVLTRGLQKQFPALQIYTISINREELRQRTQTFRQQLASVDLKFRPTAKQLYDLLLKPAQAQLAGKTKLVIVPDATLWELPFQALLASDNRYLIETAAVSYTPSLTVLREMQAQRQRRANAAADLLAFGNPSFSAETIKRATFARHDEKLVPLPEAEAEVKALGQLYGARSKVFINAEAREDRWKTEAANARILHIATHGILNNAAPMYSHLALATNDEKEDGLLEAWELLQMNLKADLAVLSACETARGRIGAGEGVIGLSWALFVAGVPSTVVSQWKVESSSTRDLMLGFHRSLKGTNGKPGVTKAEALRQAVLPLLKKPATSHPFYWAGFVLIGAGQ